MASFVGKLILCSALTCVAVSSSAKSPKDENSPANDAAKPVNASLADQSDEIIAEVERTAQDAEAVVAAEIAKSVAEAAKTDDPEVDCKDGGMTTYDMNRCMMRELARKEGEMRGYLAVARERFVSTVNDDSNDDSDKEKMAAIAEFDMAQSTWESFREAHCSSVYYEWKGGTIRGVMSLGCRIQMTEIRTRLLWQEWLTYMDSTPPILPKPSSGFEKDE